MKRALLLLALTACPGGETRVFTATYSVRGALRGERVLDDQNGGRVTCSVDVDRADPVDPSPVLTVAAVSATDGRRQPGLYVTVHGFRGEAGYKIDTGVGNDRGEVVVFDEATLTDCAREGDTACYSATRNCNLRIDSWVLGDETPPGVRTGTATGQITCTHLLNAVTEDEVELTSGTFTCKATDWTAARR